MTEITSDLTLGDLDTAPITELKTQIVAEEQPQPSISVSSPTSERLYVSCLRDEKLIVRYITRESGLVTNPRHTLYGGMADTATRVFTVPTLISSGTYKNVLTDSEKMFLEEIMRLAPNALSVHQKIDNFWENYGVRLIKGDNYLDLSIPDDYIKYKVLLANKDFIASSLQEYLDSPKVTHQFMIVSEGDEIKQSNQELSATMQAYKLLGKIESNKKVLKLIAETLDGRPISALSKLDFIITQVNKSIQANPKMFIKVATDPYIETKVLINDCLVAGLIHKRGEYYYLASDNRALCNNTEEPTLTMASKYLNAPKNQEILLAIQAKLKAMEE